MVHHIKALFRPDPRPRRVVKILTTLNALIIRAFARLFPLHLYNILSYVGISRFARVNGREEGRLNGAFINNEERVYKVENINVIHYQLPFNVSNYFAKGLHIFLPARPSSVVLRLAYFFRATAVKDLRNRKELPRDSRFREVFYDGAC